MRRHFFVALIALLCASLSQAQNQTQTTPPPTTQAAIPTATTPLPKKPKDLMLLASQVNGLHGIDKPWHLKANYQTFDADGG